jgi:hypothetical protein
MGLGTWAGRLDWPLPWLHTSPTIKVLGIVFSADYAATLAATWDRVAAGVIKTLSVYRGRHLPTLRQRVQVLTEFVLSKVWYFCQALPLPSTAAARLRTAVADFLWRGRLERLPFDELHRPRDQGGLGLPCLQTRAEALFAKQHCHFLAAGGRLAAHAAFWLGPALQPYLPALPATPHSASGPSALYATLLPLLLEVFSLPGVDVADLAAVTSRGVYQHWTSDLPPPKIERKRPLVPWKLAWARLDASAADPLAQDLFFSLLHNILPVPARLHRMGLEAASCPFCQVPYADLLHCFTACPRVAVAWGYLFARASLALNAVVGDEELLLLAWGGPASERVQVAVLAYASWVWESRESPVVLDVAVLRQKVGEATAAAGLQLRSIFD